jgi:hypothetical protein
MGAGRRPRLDGAGASPRTVHALLVPAITSRVRRKSAFELDAARVIH